MREESQLEDMRSAIRGDFERLAERRGEQALMRGPEAGARGIRGGGCTCAGRGGPKALVAGSVISP